MAYSLKPGESAQKAVRRIVASQAQKALDDLREADSPAHAARKRLKKIRAVLRLVRSGMNKADFALHNAAWREAGWLLAPLREHSARLETVARLRDQTEEPAAMAALSSLREKLEAHAPLDASVTLERAGRMIAGAAEAAASLRVSGDAVPVFVDGLKRSYRRGGELGAAAFESGAAADFHEWRKSVKTLAMQLRIVEPAAPGEIGDLRTRFEKLGESLGEDHDLAGLSALIGRFPDLLDTAEQREALDARVAERVVMLRASGRPLYEALYADKPKTFARRIETRLKDWPAGEDPS